MGRFVSPSLAVAVAACLAEFAAAGMRAEHAAVVVDAVLTARAGRPHLDDAVGLVWTGPKIDGAANLATAVVVREMFGQAVDSVTIAGLAVHQGRSVFRRLAEGMSQRSEMKVRIFLDVHRVSSEGPSDADTITRFGHKFTSQDWPQGFPLPEMYYDPRSPNTEATARASLHAKCVIVDRHSSPPRISRKPLKSETSRLEW